ncbi:MAG TPA: tripartite tricarboxylate transporter substrate binding protein [Burkholderiales bacterium]|nr:tripartite tricarboxylate transporter substrate binding protein [Burkholderiales bacterium]
METRIRGQRDGRAAVYAGMGALLGVVIFFGTAHTTYAQNYPTRPIRLIVPQAPGSASDTVARIVAAELTRQLGQQVVVDNRPGGALTIGIDMVVKAPADGYTLGYGPVGALAISPNMVRKLPYDVDKDLQAVAQIAANQMLLAASPSLPVKSVRDVISYAKQNPGKLSNASSGNGTPGHVAFELFKFMTGTQIVHVPYKGGAAGIADLISGQIHLMMESQNSITPHAKAGRVRGLAVTGATRSSALPGLPTIAEAGVPGYEASTWNGIVAPARVPKTIVARLNAEINKTLEAATVRQRFAAMGAEPVTRTPEQFRDLIRRENAKWAEVIKRSGAKIE